MKKVERSPHVKVQLCALETEVRNLRQRLDALATQRQQRETVLYNSQQVLSTLLKACAAPSSEARLQELMEKCKEANDQLERELMYTETLEHKVSATRKEILEKAGPTHPMIRELGRARVGNATEQSAVGVREHEVERLSSVVQSLQRQFTFKHSQHSQSLQSLFEQYSMQKEFVLMCEEQQKQFGIRDSVAVLDATEKNVKAKLREAKSAEALMQQAEELTQQAQKQKDALGALFQVARLQDADDIIKYFRFLEESSNTLEATRSALEERINELRETVHVVTLDFQRVAEEGTAVPPTVSKIDGLEEQVRTAEKSEEMKLSKIQWFRKEYGKMQEMIISLLGRAAPECKFHSTDVLEGLQQLESTLGKVLEDTHYETRRTATTDESELA